MTTGPIVDFKIRGVEKADSGVNRGMGTVFSVGEEWEAKPGDRVRAVSGATVHLRVSAPRWMAIARVKIIVDGSPVYDHAIDAPPLFVGKEADGPAAASRRTVRFDEDVPDVLPPTAHWMVATASGDEADEDAVPGGTLRPFAITNPIWVGPETK